MENNKCPNCGNELKITKSGSLMSVECSFCNYSFATTCSEGIEWDDSNYKIIIKEANDTNIENIKVISNITSLNFLESKKLLINGGDLFEGKAFEIEDKINTLNKNKINFYTLPNFPYKN